MVPDTSATGIMGKYAHIKKDKDMPGGLCGGGPATRGLIGVLADHAGWHADLAC